MPIEAGKIRNVAVVGHRGTGKTSLVEALLFQAGKTNRLGSIEAGTTVSDWEEDEQRRQMSLSATLVNLEWEGRKINLIDTIEDQSGPNPEVSLEQTELKEALGDAISRLPEREKLVVTLYYYEELTLREIGEVLGVTESRVSQLHTKAVLRLKARLSGVAMRQHAEA